MATSTREPVDRRWLLAGYAGLVRHPGYLGSLLTWTGFALTSRRVSVGGILSGLLAGAYRRRIAVEQQLLRRDLPGYAGYVRRTSRLVRSSGKPSA